MGLFRRASGNLLRCASGNLANTCYCTDKPKIQLEGSLQWFIESGSSGPVTYPAVVTNVGGPGTTLTWERTLTLNGGLAGKIVALPANGTLGELASQDIAHTLSPSGMANGSYTGELSVAEIVESGVSPKTLPISVVIAAGYTGPLYLKLTDEDSSVFSNSLYTMAYLGVNTGHINQFCPGQPQVDFDTPLFDTPYRTWGCNVGNPYLPLYYASLLYFYELGEVYFRFGTKTFGAPLANYITKPFFTINPVNGAPLVGDLCKRFVYRAWTSGTVGLLVTIQDEPFT